jgi:hypothetical protein
VDRRRHILSEPRGNGASARAVSRVSPPPKGAAPRTVRRSKTASRCSTNTPHATSAAVASQSLRKIPSVARTLSRRARRRARTAASAGASADCAARRYAAAPPHARGSPPRYACGFLIASVPTFERRTLYTPIIACGRNFRQKWIFVEVDGAAGATGARAEGLGGALPRAIL